jgi:hypothetical protein
VVSVDSGALRDRLAGGDDWIARDVKARARVGDGCRY